MDYHSPRWKKLREYVLRRDGYRCQHSKRFGLTREARTVHHVIPVRDRPDLEWEPSLMVSLSLEAHNAMHDRDSDNLSDEGKALANRIISRLSNEERERMRLNPY